jgi:hypothetical protein
MKQPPFRSAPIRLAERGAAMPYDVKAILSAIALIVAAILAYWSGSPIRHDFSTFVMVVAALMVAAMWVFPEAGVKKGDMKRAK